MVTQQDYEDLARQVEYIFSLIVQMNTVASNLHVPIPQDLARAWAHMGTAWPREIREVGARRAGTWVDTPTEHGEHERPEQP